MVFLLQFKNDYAKRLHRTLPVTNNKYIIIHRQKDSFMSAHFLINISYWSTTAHFFLASYLSNISAGANGQCIHVLGLHVNMWLILWPGAAAKTRQWNPENGIAYDLFLSASSHCVNMSESTREFLNWTDTMVCRKLWNPVLSSPCCLTVACWICKLQDSLHLVLFVQSFSSSSFLWLSYLA